MGNMHANFQVSRSTGVGREWCDIWKDRHYAVFGPIPVQKFLTPPGSNAARNGNFLIKTSLHLQSCSHHKKDKRNLLWRLQAIGLHEYFYLYIVNKKHPIVLRGPRLNLHTLKMVQMQRKIPNIKSFFEFYHRTLNSEIKWHLSFIQKHIFSWNIEISLWCSTHRPACIGESDVRPSIHLPPQTPPSV